MTATTTTTIPALSVETAALETVTFDFYRDIHKGIRAELFAVTHAAGSVDPHNVAAVNSRPAPRPWSCWPTAPSTRARPTPASRPTASTSASPASPPPTWCTRSSRSSR